MARKLSLQDFLPYLLNRAGVRMGIMFSKDIEPHEITLPMWRVMNELWHRGEFRLGELAERTDIDISTLSRLLVTMQKKGLIVRRRSGSDGRALSLTLTPEGLELSERIAPLALHYEALAMQGLSPAEVKTLKQLLQRVFQNLENAGPERVEKETAGKPRAVKRAAPRARLKDSA
ncbi:MAG: MarR family transcriptional regulator [Beijerinckiaceae bacterium]|jgi:MarR family transcriptional regulator, organic hydroperoxide resistance regulator|nr:MarR family transcriptional regulator [Beijerinckiaceae bacterium]MDO9442786.1 MarR family transcriptional regulator [Beijerinckiaceae bacterium]